MKHYFKNLSNILLEADNEEEDLQSDDYSMDKSVTDLGEEIDNQDSEGGEETEDVEGGETDSEGGDDTEEDYSMDGENPDESGDMEGTGDDMGESDDMGEDAEGESDTTENYKKYRLLVSYRDFISDIVHLLNSVNKFQDNIDSDLRDHSIFIERKLKELKDKCSFTIQHEFLNKPYTELITSFLYFKKELEEILNLIEKLIKYNKE